MEIKIAMGHFWLTFKNGYTLSVYNGFGSYTENKENYEKEANIIEFRNIHASWTSRTVEIAILNKDGELVTNKILKNKPDLVATVDIAELLGIINALSLMM